jgi:carbamoyl-phosphate synthase large subunit
MKVLVTGIAGDIGNGIGRILRGWSGIDRVFGCDIHDEHMGRRNFDACEVVPRADASGYALALEDLRQRWQLDAIVATSEPELRLISRASPDSILRQLPFVMANGKAMTIGFDKLTTAHTIADLGCPAPWTRLVATEAPERLPCILKSRYGAGAQGIHLVSDEQLIPAYRALYPEAIWQEYISGERGEYTCGVYGCTDGDVRTIVLRRRLAAGVTSYAEVVSDPAIEALCERVARGLELRGSINIQLRLSDRGPLVFEINPRFSSTVVFRDRLGFRDLIWSLQEQVLGQPCDAGMRPAPGTRMYRAFDEVIGDA